MNLKDPSFLTFTGDPIMGQPPTRLFVGGAELNKWQATEVRNVYQKHCMNAGLSISPSSLTHKVLLDGTSVRILRNGLQDTVFVEHALKGGGGTELPHGFLVEGSWIDPQVLGLRDQTGLYPVWVNPPQALKGIYGTHQLCHFEGSAEVGNFRVVPVVAAGDNGVWDMAWHSTQTSESRPKPLPLKITGDDATDFWHNPHFGGGASIHTGEGVSVYTMAEPSAIIAEDPSPIYFPAQANAIGTMAVLQGVRFAYVNDGLQAFAFRSEVVHRVAPAVPPSVPPVEYVLDQARSLFMYVPLATTVSDTVVGASDLGEDPSAVVGGTRIVNANPPLGRDLSYGNFITRADGAVDTYGWYGVDGEYTYAPTVLEGVELIPFPLAWASGIAEPYTYRSRTTSTKTAKQIKEHAVALMGITDCEYASIEHDIGYPRNSYIRTGAETWSLGQQMSWFTGGGAGYSDASNTITRRELTVSVITPISSTLKFIWGELNILEGEVNSQANLLYKTDQKRREFRSIHYAYSIFDRQNIPGFLPSSAPLPLAQIGYPPWTPLIPAGTTATKPDIFTSFVEGSSLNPAFLATQTAYIADVGFGAGVMAPTIVDAPLTNSVAYSYTTRHIIDYDHKGQFCVAIRVTVACSGATWGEPSSPPWRGASETKSDANYTVTIKLEVKWADKALREQTLYTGFCTRPCFESVRMRYKNIYYPLGGFADDPTHDIFVRIAPQLNVPSDSYAQLYTLAYPQETSDNLVCADYLGDSDFSDPELASTDSFDYSQGEDYPQQKYRPGVLYKRTFKLGDFPSALYLIGACKISCTQNDLPLTDENGDSIPGRVSYFYIPTLKTCIETEEFNILIRDDAFEDWTVDLIGAADTTVWPNSEKPRPADPKTWNIKLNRI